MVLNEADLDHFNDKYREVPFLSVMTVVGCGMV